MKLLNITINGRQGLISHTHSNHEKMTRKEATLASGGGVEAGGRAGSSHLNHRSWANVVKPWELAPLDQPANINQKENLEKLKSYVNEVVMVAKEMQVRATNRMANSLFGKFLGKAPPLEMVKRSLQEMWRGMGPFSISDMYNGFYFIRCEKP